MKAAGVLFCLKFASIVFAASDAPRPRGVGPEFAKHYRDSKEFACISEPKSKIAFARVNDDYCDCPDGSDEPGTSACANLSPLSPRTPDASNTTQVLPGFYCKNKGHIPSYVPFTNVNDGVCDYEQCCDGSEEWESVGGVKCEDRCKEIGKEWRKANEARQKSLGNAAKRRKEMVLAAKRARQEVEDRMKTLRTEIEGAEIKVKKLEEEVADVEKREKAKVVRTGSKTGGKLGVLVGLAQQRTEELRDTLEWLRKDRDQSRTRMRELEEILSDMKADYDPNFNDAAVKLAVRSWEDYAAHDKPESDDARNRDLDEIMKSDKDNGLDWDQYGSEEESEIDVLYAFENYLPPTVRAWLDQKLRDLRVMLIEGGILAESTSTSESKVVTDARNRLSTARKELENSRNDLNSRTEDLAKDYGPDDVFRALKGTCISTESGEYTYELCFLDKTMQKPKKGHGNTNMGNFARIETITVDDELPANGKGLGSGERIVMRHENGQHCWHGPNRSCSVVLACAEENEIWKIVEEEKCVYRMEVGTPAVCDVGGGNGKESGKDEL